MTGPNSSQAVTTRPQDPGDSGWLPPRSSDASSLRDLDLGMGCLFWIICLILWRSCSGLVLSQDTGICATSSPTPPPTQALRETPPLCLSHSSIHVSPGPSPGYRMVLPHAWAQFGGRLETEGRMLPPIPNNLHLCEEETPGRNYHGMILLTWRGKCSFARKARVAQNSGAAGLIVAPEFGRDDLYPHHLLVMKGINPALTIPSVGYSILRCPLCVLSGVYGCGTALN